MRIPRGAKAEFGKRLVELQTDWDGYDAYVVAHGERLARSSGRFAARGERKRLV